MSAPEVPRWLSPAAVSDATAEADELYQRHLAARAAAGDLGAIQALLKTITPLLRRVVAGALGGGHANLDDVVQQALIAVQHALPAFRGECHPSGYASRIALRVALRARRRHKVDLARREAFVRLETGTELSHAPAADAEAEQRRRLLRDLLDELPEEQADALGLRVMLGWSLEEVASATGAPLNTVRSRVRLAKEALRRRIESAPELADLRGTR